MNRPGVTVIAVIVIAGAMVAAAGCKKHIDTDDAANKVKQFAEDNIGETTAVTCPEAEMKAGVTFTCKVTFAAGGTEPISITLADDKGGTGTWKWGTPLGGGPKFDLKVAQIIKDKSGKDATIDCGDQIVEVPADGLTCKAVVSGQPMELTVKIDADGNASIEPKKS